MQLLFMSLEKRRCWLSSDVGDGIANDWVTAGFSDCRSRELVAIGGLNVQSGHRKLAVLAFP